MSDRKPMKPEVIKRLLAKSGNRCAFEGCPCEIFTDDNVYVANYCHINAVNSGGKRHDAALSSDYINSYENIILLCTKHHKIVDTLDNVYTVEVLKEMKAKHDAMFSSLQEVSSDLLMDAVQQYSNQILQILSELQSVIELNSQKIDQNTQKMDDFMSLVKAKVFVDEKSMDLTEQLKDLKELKKSGQYQAALTMLFNYQKKYWETISEEFRYKILLNIGMTYFDLQANEKAGETLIGLKDSPYNGEYKESNVAIGYMLLNDVENARLFANKALEKNAKDVNAFVVLIESNDVNEQDLPPEVISKPEIQISIAKAYERKADYKKAAELYDQLLLTSKDDEIINIVKVMLSLSIYTEIKRPELLMLGRITDATKKIISRSLSLMDEAIAHYKKTDLMPSKWFLVANKGIFEKLLGKTKEAEVSFLNSLQLKKDYFTYKHLIILYIPDERMLDVIRQAREIPLPEDDLLELLLIEAEYFLQKERKEDCDENLKKAKQFVKKGTLIEEYFYTVFFDYLISIGDLESLQKELVQFNENSDLEFIYLFYALQLAAKSNDPEKYASLAEDTIRCINTSIVPLPNQLSIGKFFFAANDFENAIRIYENLANKEVFQNLSYDLIFCYYKTGRYQDAEEWILGFLNANQVDERLVDGLSTIYTDLNRLPDAIVVLKDFLASNQNNYLKVKLCISLCQSKLFSEAAEVLNTITDTANFNLQTQFLIARAYQLCGLKEKAYFLVYDLRRKNFQEPLAHRSYMNFIFAANDSTTEECFPKTVINNCYVNLKGPDKTFLEYIICDDPILPMEILCSSSIAKKILGKAVGAKVTIDKVGYSVESIMSKTTHAFHDSSYILRTRYNETGFKYFEHSDTKSPEENLAPIFTMMDQQAARQKQLNQFYKEKQATIGIMAKHFYENPIKYWQRVVGTDELGVNWHNPYDSPGIAGAMLNEGIGMVIDITSLLPIHNNAGWHILDKITNPKFVSATTMDLIEQELDELKQSSARGGFMSVIKTAQGYTRHEVTTADIQKRTEYINDFKSQILSRATVLSSPISNDFFQKQQWDDIIGVSFNDSLILAKSEGVMLFSDDAVLRDFARAEKNIVGLSLPILLSYLLNSQKITDYEWRMQTGRLIQLNYKGIPVNGYIIYDCYDADGFRPGIYSERAVETLISERRPEAKASVTADFLQMLYSNSDLMDKRDIGATWMLGKYFKQNTTIISKRMLIIAIEDKFKLLAPQKDMLMPLLNKLYPIA